MRLTFSAHAKRRMRERKISSDLAKEVVTTAQYRSIDSATAHTVCVKRLMFRENERYIAVSLQVKTNAVKIVSIHPIRDRDFTSRIRSGRWKYETKS